MLDWSLEATNSSFARLLKWNCCPRRSILLHRKSCCSIIFYFFQNDHTLANIRKKWRTTTLPWEKLTEIQKMVNRATLQKKKMLPPQRNMINFLKEIWLLFAGWIGNSHWRLILEILRAKGWLAAPEELSNGPSKSISQKFEHRSGICWCNNASDIPWSFKLTLSWIKWTLFYNCQMFSFPCAKFSGPSTSQSIGSFGCWISQASLSFRSLRCQAPSAAYCWRTRSLDNIWVGLDQQTMGRPQRPAGHRAYWGSRARAAALPSGAPAQPWPPSSL